MRALTIDVKMEGKWSWATGDFINVCESACHTVNSEQISFNPVVPSRFCRVTRTRTWRGAVRIRPFFLTKIISLMARIALFLWWVWSMIHVHSWAYAPQHACACLNVATLFRGRRIIFVAHHEFLSPPSPRDLFSHFLFFGLRSNFSSILLFITNLGSSNVEFLLFIFQLDDIVVTYARVCVHILVWVQCRKLAIFRQLFDCSFTTTTTGPQHKHELALWPCLGCSSHWWVPVDTHSAPVLFKKKIGRRSRYYSGAHWQDTGIADWNQLYRMIRENFKMLNQYAVDIPTLPVNLFFSSSSWWNAKPFFRIVEPQRWTAKHFGTRMVYRETFLKIQPRLLQHNIRRNWIHGVLICRNQFTHQRRRRMRTKHQFKIRDASLDRQPKIQSSLVREILQRIMGQTNNDYRSQDWGMYLFTISYGSFAVIKEVELVDLVDDLKSSCSVRGFRKPDVEAFDARIASTLNRIIHNTQFKRRVSLEEQ